MVVSGKRELIEAFIDQKMPLLGPDDDVRVAFRTFWEEERTKAYLGLIEREGLDPAAFEALHRDILFSGKQPLADEVVAAMRLKPNILKRKAAVARVLHGIEQLISAFGEGVGDEADECHW